MHVGINQGACCGMSPYSSTAPVALHSVENEPLHVTLHVTDGSVECGIFGSACSQVEIDGVPGAWDAAEVRYDCMELQCQHKFNACALALHFLANRMTCPLCRQGVPQRMSLSCAPDNVKLVYLKHILPSASADLLEFDPAVFLSDLRLHVDFIPCYPETGPMLSLTTPCIAVDQASDAESIFRTHHSFRRHFNRIMKTGNVCRFSLLHPLIFMSLCSEDLSCDDLCAYDLTLPHGIAVVCCCIQHDVLTVTLQLNLAVLYSMCVSTVMQYMDDN
jgi:hypothetical protein